jgi:hypothetical protein
MRVSCPCILGRRSRCSPKPRRALIELAAVVALFAALALPAAAQKAEQKAPANPPAAQAEGYRLEGFRSAAFGMTEQQVRNAIRKDFNLSGDKVKVEENAIEKTTLLTVTVPELLPDAGPARIAYILGFKSKKLVQVNLLWGTPVGERVRPEKLRGAAEALGQYFLGLGFPRENVVANVKLKDGTWVVFQGSDAQKRTAVLRFAESPAADGKPAAAMMSLFYIQNPDQPDVFRIGRGQF